MTVSLKEMMARRPLEERRRIEKRAKELIAEEMTLRKLRKEFALTQERVAERMGVEQETVSRIEQQRTDVKLSTLKKYINALGGDLQLVATFPDLPPVTVRDLAVVTAGAKARRHLQGRARPPARQR
jgi:transcriptional regulator with XRE-family HTH domain